MQKISTDLVRSNFFLGSRVGKFDTHLCTGVILETTQLLTHCTLFLIYAGGDRVHTCMCVQEFGVCPYHTLILSSKLTIGN